MTLGCRASRSISDRLMIRGQPRLVRMNADRRVHERILLGQPNPGIEFRRTVPVADGDHSCDPGLACTRDHLLAVRVELLAIEVCVGIDEHVGFVWGQPPSALPAGGYFSRAPTGTSSKKPASTGCAAFQRRRHDHPVRLQTTHLSRREIRNDHHLAAHECLRRIGFGNARENLAHFRPDIDFQTQQLVGDFGTRSATFTSPTRRSTLTKSSIVIFPSEAVGAAAGTLAVVHGSGCGAGSLPSPPPQPALVADLPSAASFRWRSCRRGGTPGSTSPSFVPSGSWPHCQLVQVKFLDVAQSHLLPRFLQSRRE